MGGCALLTLCAVLVLCTLQLRRREQSLVTLRMIGAGKTALVALCLVGKPFFCCCSACQSAACWGRPCAATLCRAGARALSQPAVGDSWRWRGLPAPGPCCWAFCCLPCGRPGKTRPICPRKKEDYSAVCGCSRRCRCGWWCSMRWGLRWRCAVCSEHPETASLPHGGFGSGAKAPGRTP